MLVYIPTFLITFVCTWYATNFKEKFNISKKKADFAWFLILISVIFIVLTFVSDTRYGIGMDYLYTDNRVLNVMREGIDISFNEKIVTLFAKAIINSGMPNYVFFVTFSIITNLAYIIAIFINKNNNYFISIFIYLFYYIYFNSFNQTRGSAAIALGILGFSIVYNFKSNAATLFGYNFCILGVLLHYSEIINVVILTLFILIRHFSNKINTKKLLSFGFILIAISPILFIILKYTISYIPIINKYAYYFNPNYDQSSTPLLKFLGSFFTFIVPFISLIFYLFNFTKEDDYFLKFTGALLIINMIFLTIALLTNSILLADRLKSMFYAFDLFTIPYMYSKMKDDNQKYMYIGIVGLIMIIVTLSTLIPSNTYPYRSIFFKYMYIF